MARLMSVTLTEDAVVERRKTVTRRLGWRFLKPGDRLTLCRKVMGRQGAPLVRLAEVEVVSVRRERLCQITEEDVVREGVDPDVIGGSEPSDWVMWFCEEMNVGPYDEVTRVEWRYLDESHSGRSQHATTPQELSQPGASPDRRTPISSQPEEYQPKGQQT